MLRDRDDFSRRLDNRSLMHKQLAKNQGIYLSNVPTGVKSVLFRGIHEIRPSEEQLERWKENRIVDAENYDRTYDKWAGLYGTGGMYAKGVSTTELER